MGSKEGLHDLEMIALFQLRAVLLLREFPFFGTSLRCVNFSADEMITVFKLARNDLVRPYRFRGKFIYKPEA